MPAQLAVRHRPPGLLEALARVYNLLGVRKIATNSDQPNGDGGVERVNHTRAQMLATVVIELQNNWDEQLPHVELAYYNSVSAAAGLAPNEVHMGRLPRLPLASFERTGVDGHQSLARDHLAYYDLATDSQHARTISSVNTMPPNFLAWNSAIQPSPTHCTRFPKFAVGGWHLPRREDGHGRQGPQGQALAQLDGPLQSPRSWPLYPR